MKFGVLKSIGHNIADSFASGIGNLIGYNVQIDVFAEAARTPDGHITVDFLSGVTTGGQPSQSLAQAVELYQSGLFDLCAKHRAEPSAFSELSVTFSQKNRVDRFLVTVADQHGRRSVDEYIGVRGKRVNVPDDIGRVRKNQSI